MMRLQNLSYTARVRLANFRSPVLTTNVFFNAGTAPREQRRAHERARRDINLTLWRFVATLWPPLANTPWHIVVRLR